MAPSCWREAMAARTARDSGGVGALERNVAMLENTGEAW